MMLFLLVLLMFRLDAVDSIDADDVIEAFDTIHAVDALDAIAVDKILFKCESTQTRSYLQQNNMLESTR